MKKWKFWVMLVLTLAYAGWLGYTWYSNQITSTEARVNITGRESNVLLGTIVYKAGDVYLDRFLDDPFPVRITVPDGTPITKTVYYLPSLEELQANDWSYNTEDLRQETGTSTLDEMLADGASLWVTVRSEDNIYLKKEFTASAIEYEQEVGSF